MTPHERLLSPGPKRILCCDGGGIRGLISIGILSKLESELRQASGDPELVLADYFDMVCGTSTGAIIATCISCGMDVAAIRSFYREKGPLMFERTALWRRIRYRYEDEALAAMLRTQINAALGDSSDAPALLGDERLRTLLMVVLRNHTTDSPWPVSNNKLAHYNDLSRIDCNLQLPLWQVVRASTAAPTYFPPEVIVFGEGTPQEYSFLFVDGGVTTYNNPAFLAFKMATAEPYRMNWKAGLDDLLIVSVGTGQGARERPGVQPSDLWLLDHAQSIPSALMNAASAGWDMTCRIIGDCRFGEPIDREFGDGIAGGSGPVNWTGPKQFTYVRYDPDVTARGLARLGCLDIEATSVQAMDSVARINEIERVGDLYAAGVTIGHFANFPPAARG